MFSSASLLLLSILTATFQESLFQLSRLTCGNGASKSMPVQELLGNLGPFTKPAFCSAGLLSVRSREVSQIVAGVMCMKASLVFFLTYFLF
uniref:Putative secreted protein n=1 Tax=Amblyomma cajennense TaxID=34607 RepID=A0A023FDL1_AMBCJ